MTSDGTPVRINMNLGFRTVRIGTLKTYTTSEKDALKFDSKRMKFSVTLRQENSNEPVKIILPCKHITFVKSYLGRGCPVIWLQTADECTRYLHKVMGMKQGRVPTPYYDPHSKIMAERYVAIILAEDPIPYQNVFLFKKIILEIHENRGLAEEAFHERITQNLCNRMLVEATNIADKIFNFQKKVKNNPNLKISENLPVEIKVSSSLMKEKPKEKEKETEIPQELPKKPPSEKPTPLPSPVSNTTSSTPKNVNRARKSIPKSSRSISLENQLDEIRAKRTGLSPPMKPMQQVSMHGNPSIDHNVSHTNQESTSDGNTSNDSSTSTVKKKRPKDPFLWKGRMKQRHTAAKQSYQGNGMYQVTGCFSPKLGQTPLTTTSATSDLSMKSRIQFGEESHEELSGRYDATSLCLCSERSPFVVSSDDVKCMAFENVDGRLLACTNIVKTPMMMKASQHVPALALCKEHRERMIRHECCPGCGTFCAGGTFLVCVSTKECPHRFHKDCLLLYRQTKDCLHCGGPMSLVREVHIEPRQDHKLRWVIAGQDPQKMEKKRLTANREKTARMSHRIQPLEEVQQNDGIVKEIRPGITIDTSTLPRGKDRDSLEDLICQFSEASGKKVRIHPKAVSQLAQQGENMKLLQFFSDADDSDVRNVLKSSSILSKSVVNDNIKTVYLLNLFGIKHNAKDSKGKTPLFYAEERELVDIINYLILVGADMKQKDSEGMTCFHHAAKNGRIVSCATLLRHDADIINMPDDGGWTPVVWAAEHGQTNMAKYLEYFSANVENTDKEGNICLHWAALSGNLELLMMCLRKQCDINFKNIHGDTALHIAARRDHLNCVVALLCWGCNPSLKNNEGKTPMECAMLGTPSLVHLKFKDKLDTCSSNQEVPPDREKLLCSDVSRGFENLPVSCVNSVDDAPCPTDPGGFKYVTSNVHSSQDTIIKDPSNKMQSCQCFSRCENSTCLCCLLSEKCWYDEDGFLVPEFDLLEPPLVFECSETCWCPPSCRNRVVQKGIRYNLQIHRTSSMGWSVKTLDTIPQGAFVCEYVGELISDAEADIREDDSYLFDLENKDGEIFCIDARYYGNISRFINHLCEPNLVPLRVFIDHHDIRFPRLAYFSTRLIKAGEELGFDYGDRFWDVKCRQFTCGCGLPQCKYSEEAYRLKKEQEEKQREKELLEEEKDSSKQEDETS